MKTFLAVALIALFMVPSATFAGHWPYRHGRRYGVHLYQQRHTHNAYRRHRWNRFYFRNYFRHDRRSRFYFRNYFGQRRHFGNYFGGHRFRYHRRFGFLFRR
ncbi:MAG: hypothetical protein ACE5HC_16665 [Candidatus Binatia bacterium]